MPHFYFHIADDTGVLWDDEGLELPNLRAAYFEGKESARELLIQEIRGNREVDNRRIEVTDRDGKIIKVFLLRDLIH